MKALPVFLLAALIGACGGEPSTQAARPPALLATATQPQEAARDLVQLLYIATLGRPADPAGLAYWSAALASSGAPLQLGEFAASYKASAAVRMIADGIADSAETRLLHSPADETMIGAVYANILSRPMDTAARASWASRIATGELTRPQALVALLAEVARTEPLAMAGKLAVANGFSARIDTAELRPLYRGIIANSAVRLSLGLVGAGTDTSAATGRMVEAMSSAITSTIGKPQTIWFAPADPAVRTWVDSRNGSEDYMQLFSPGAPWAQAAARVKIFKMYSNVFLLPHLPGSLTDDQVRTVLADLKRRNIALAVEHGPLYEDPVPPHCGTGVEGFGGSASLRLAERVRDLGGELAYLAMDEPFQHARDVCGWSAQEIARNAAASIAEIRKVFPDVQVGDIEVVPGSALMPDWVAQYGQWMDAWKQETGRALAFFHADINWGIDYASAVGHARRIARDRGIPFGVIYNGWYSDRSDAEWVATGMRNYASVELGGEVPEQAIFQSWDHFPERVLPETDSSTFTYLINSYFRPRTAMSLAAGAGSAHGMLELANGVPLGGQEVKLLAQPVGGRGTMASYSLSGTVPANTPRALIQVCINQCGETGTNDMTLYSFAYFDTGGQLGSFGSADGWTRWGADPSGTASLNVAREGAYTVMHTSATRSQRTFLNSAPFAVTPGSRFSMSIKARISPDSIGSGAIAVIFLREAEVSRTSMPFRPASITLGKAVTASDGSYRIRYVTPTGRHLLRAQYAGTAQYWPAQADTMLGH
jgi:hypothetical protein